MKIIVDQFRVKSASCPHCPHCHATPVIGGMSVTCATVATARGFAAWPVTRHAFRRRPGLRSYGRGSKSFGNGVAGGGRVFPLSSNAELNDVEDVGTSDSSVDDTSSSTPNLKLGTNAKQADVDGAPHVPVLMRQVLDCFSDVTLSTFIDCTIGAGGHSSSIVQRHPEMRRYIGFDVDPLAHMLAKPRIEQAATEAMKNGSDDENDDDITNKKTSFSFNPITANFRELRDQLNQLSEGLEINSIDGIFMDLGVSSMHLDLPERGFSFNDDGPLDMRMGPSAPLSAFDVVNDWPEEEIARILKTYGEEKHWRLLAKRICEARIDEPIETTHELVKALGRVPGVKHGRSGNVHPATRTFQAVRIAANDELGAIEDAIPAAIDALKPGGRLAIITFHSLEDKIVKNAFRQAAGRIVETDRPYSAWEKQPPAPPKIVKLITRKPLIADADELKLNVRARSAKLRVCEKL